VAKESGLGDQLYVGGANLSGDIGSIQSLSGSVGVYDVTGIDKQAHERIGGQRDGQLQFTAFFNPTAGAAHPVLAALPTTDTLCSYLHGQVIGNPAASMLAKQLNYDGTRDDGGAFTFKVAADANGYGLDWGVQVTAGVRTDTAATNGTALDTAASLSFGGQLYLHVFAVTGTSVVVKLQDSADNSSFADVASAAFTAATGPGFQRIQLAATATLRRYLRVATTGTFSNAQFAVVASKNPAAVVF
jgi:hypothetical protein